MLLLSVERAVEPSKRTIMKCFVVICVGALVALAASKPTNKFNRNHSSLAEVSSAVVAVSPDYVVDPSNLSMKDGNNLLPYSLSGKHKRVRRTVIGDGKNCPVGKVRVGNRCVSCALWVLFYISVSLLKKTRKNIYAINCWKNILPNLEYSS